MPRYFFDVVNETGTAHDHQGREFNCPDSAKRQGELFAIDLRFAPARGHTGDKVAVHVNADGTLHNTSAERRLKRRLPATPRLQNFARAPPSGAALLSGRTQARRALAEQDAALGFTAGSASHDLHKSPRRSGRRNGAPRR
jgi:hypothetical protein